MNPNNNNESNHCDKRNSRVDPEIQRKADRALIILYVVMAVFILAPFVLYFLRK